MLLRCLLRCWGAVMSASASLSTHCFVLQVFGWGVAGVGAALPAGVHGRSAHLCVRRAHSFCCMSCKRENYISRTLIQSFFFFFKEVQDWVHVYLPQIKGFEHQGHHQLDGPSSWRSSVFRQSKLLPFLSHFYCNRCWVLVFSFPGELCTKQQQQKKMESN